MEKSINAKAEEFRENLFKTSKFKNAAPLIAIGNYPGLFNAGDQLSISVQSGSLGDRYVITNFTQGSTKVIWRAEYGSPFHKLTKPNKNVGKLKGGDTVIVNIKVENGKLIPEIVTVADDSKRLLNSTTREETTGVYGSGYRYSQITMTLDDWEKLVPDEFKNS